MKDEVFREPLDGDNGYYTYSWHDASLVQMQWSYGIDWTANGKPTIWVHSYRCLQRDDLDNPWREVENLPFDIPMSDAILHAITLHAAQQLFVRSSVVGSIKRVPEGFVGWAEQASKKRYDLKLLRKMGQRSAAEAKPR